jgi:hypothetical protein
LYAIRMLLLLVCDLRPQSIQQQFELLDFKFEFLFTAANGPRDTTAAF